MDSPLKLLLNEKKHDLVSVEPNTTVHACIEIMNSENIGSLLVSSEKKIKGIFTERDVLKKVIIANLDINRILVHEVMTKKVLVATTSMTVSDAMSIMTEKRVRHLPVIADDNTIDGMISIGDITKWINRDQQHTISELEKYIHGN